MTVENWGLEMEPTFHPDEGLNDELFEGNIWKDLPTPPRSPVGPVLDFEMELPGFPFPDLGYQGVAEVLTTLPALEEHSARTSGGHASKLSLKSEPLDSYFVKTEPMSSAAFGKSGHVYQPLLKSESIDSMFVKNEPMNSVFVKNNSMDSVFGKNEPLDSAFVKSEPMDSVFIKTEPLDSVLKAQESLRDIDSENFLDSITNYYPKEEQNHLGPFSLPCDSDCEEDTTISAHKAEDVINHDCMWNGLDDIKMAKKIKNLDLDEGRLSDVYIPYTTNPAQRSNSSTTSPCSPKADVKKVPNGGVENTSLTDHCYYNNGLPTPYESDLDEEDRKKVISSEDDSEDTVTMPNGQPEMQLKFINLPDGQVVGHSFRRRIEAALVELRKSGKPLNGNTLIELTVSGKRKYRLRVAPKKEKYDPYRKALKTVIADITAFSSPVAVSPLRNSNPQITTIPVARLRRTSRKREESPPPPPVKPTTKRKKQNTVAGGRSRKRRRTSSGSESEANEDIGSGGKRVFHNTMERQRRIHLKESFDNLRHLVPSLQERTKTPKVLTLRESASYCIQLGDMENKLKKEKESLQAKQKELKIQLRLLKPSSPY